MLSTQELCDKYKITRQTSINWRKQGMPCIVLGTRTVIFDEVAVEAWVEENKRRY